MLFFDSKPSAISGVIAVIITCAAIVGGKYLSVEFAVDQFLTDESVAPDFTNSELMISYVADDLIAEREQAGEKITWPAGVDPELAEKEADYPPMIWRDARSRWTSLTPEQQGEVSRAMEANYRTSLAAIRGQIISEGFAESFSGFDIVFFLLGIVTAYKVAAGTAETA
jgi:hypothetical protein